MHDEIQLGASYIVRLLNRYQKLDHDQVERLTSALASILCDKFEGHWYPEKPHKGQAYRCIRIERSSVVDDSILQACVQSGLRCSQLDFPRTMYIWIDPKEVSCRLGENCNPFIVKPSEEPKKIILAIPEKHISDSHSEGSDMSGPPSDISSDDDEENVKSKKKPSVIASQKMGAQFYYNPAPSSTVFYQFPGTAMGYVPAYQPVTMYYVVPKYYHNIKFRTSQKKWKAKKASTKR